MDVSGLRRIAGLVWWMVFLFPAAVSAQGSPRQHFTGDDQALVLGWLGDADLVAYSTSNNATADHDRWFGAYSLLRALHSSRPERFYEYLAKRMVAAPSDDSLILLLRPTLALQQTQEQALATMLAQHRTVELAEWLHHDIDLDVRLGNDKVFATHLFAVLTQSTVDATGHCPERSTPEQVNSSREERQAILQCLARFMDQPVVDIDISRNRVMLFRLLSPQPANLHLPSPVVLDNSRNHFAMIPDFYHNTELQPIILLTTPTDSGFITTTRTRATHLPTMNRGLDSRLPAVRLTRSDRNKLRQAYGIPAKDEHAARQKSSLEFWITSPGYSIAASFAIGVGIALFVAYYPYPGNPFLPPM